MRLFFLLITLLSFTTVTNAQMTTYFHYDNKILTLSKESFRRYVRPQAKSMLKDFFYILTKLNPLHGNLVQIKTQIEEMSITWEESKELCEKSFRSEDFLIQCQDTFSDFYGQSRKLDLLIMKMQANKIKFSNAKTEYAISALFSLSSTVDDILNLNYQNLHFSEEYLITSGSTYALYVDIDKKISPLLHQMGLASDGIITSQLKKDDRIDFDFIWANFFKELEHYIVNKSDKAYLLKRLEELNIAWNTFNMKITKGPKTFPKQITSVIKIMHNRRNNILKIVLRNM